jgi:hypothetical protein
MPSWMAGNQKSLLVKLALVQTTPAAMKMLVLSEYIPAPQCYQLWIIDQRSHIWLEGERRSPSSEITRSGAKAKVCVAMATAVGESRTGSAGRRVQHLAPCAGDETTSKSRARPATLAQFDGYKKYDGDISYACDPLAENLGFLKVAILWDPVKLLSKTELITSILWDSYDQLSDNYP